MVSNYYCYVCFKDIKEKSERKTHARKIHKINVNRDYWRRLFIRDSSAVHDPDDAQFKNECPVCNGKPSPIPHGAKSSSTLSGGITILARCSKCNNLYWVIKKYHRVDNLEDILFE
jgi:uncharacterized protein with PIN domain